MQKVIAARDFDVYVNFDVIGIAFKLETAVSFSANVTGTTDDIGALSSDEAIATDNGGNTYDITIVLQQAEALTIMDAVAAASASLPDGSISHIRQIIEAATITEVWHKKRDVPVTSTVKTYTNCTGVEESVNIERRATESQVTWQWRGRSIARVTASV